MAKNFGRWGLALVAVALVALLLSACGGGGSGTEGLDEVADDPVTVTEAPDSPGDAAAVCDGTANGDAADYDQGDGTVAVFEREQGSDYEFRSYVDNLPEGTVATNPDEASVVVCFEITNSEVVDSCTYTDEQSGDEFTVDIANATYNVTIREATTARVIEEEMELEGEVRDCPGASTFTEGQNSKIDYARPAAELQTLLGPIAIGGK